MGHTDTLTWSIDLLSDVSNANGQFLLSGSRDQTIKLWNYATGELYDSFNANLQIRTLTVLSNTSFEKTTSTTTTTTRESKEKN